MAIKISAKGFEEKLSALKDLLKRSQAKAIFEALGRLAASRLVGRTRLGFGVDDDQDKEPMKVPLFELTSESYLKFRKSGKIALSPFAKPNSKRSNLTLTGQLLDGVDSKAKPGGFQIVMKNNRTDGKKNTDIVDWQKKQGREFFALSRDEIKVVQKKYEQAIRKLIRVLNRRLK